MRMSLLVVHTIVISYLTFYMYYFVSDTIVYLQNSFVNPILFFRQFLQFSLLIFVISSQQKYIMIHILFQNISFSHL